MHILSNNIFNQPEFDQPSGKKLMKRKSINENSAENLNNINVITNTQENVISPLKNFINYSLTPKIKKKQSDFVLPMIRGSSLDHDSNDNKQKDSLDNFAKNKQLYEKKQSFKVEEEPNSDFNGPIVSLLKSQVRKHSELFEGKKKGETPNEANSGSNPSLLSSKKVEETPGISSPTKQMKKPPLPPRPCSNYIQKKDVNEVLFKKISNESAKNLIDLYERPKSKDSDAIERINTESEIGCKSHHSSSALKEKNFYDLNKHVFKDKILKSLDSQSKNQSLYINHILTEESKKSVCIDEYIEKGISEKIEKDKQNEMKSKHNKVKVFKNYFQVIDDQLNEKKKSKEVADSLKKIRREEVDREVSEDVLVENELKQKEKLIKMNYREFLNNQMLANKKLKIKKIVLNDS